jgi:hypothetical protein
MERVGKIIEVVFKQTLVVFFLIMLGAGCGSSSGPENGESVSGVVAGKSFILKSGAYDTKGDSIKIIALVEQGDICEMAQANQVPDDYQWLSVSFCNREGNQEADYQIIPGNAYIPCSGNIAWAEIRRMIGGIPSLISAEGGQIKIESYSENKVTGTINVNFSDEGSLSGNFDVDFCDELNN